MLKPEPRLNLRFRFDAWSGTPDELSLGAAGIFQAFPDGDLRITVTDREGRERKASDPAALKQLAPTDKLKTIDIQIYPTQYPDNRSVLVNLGNWSSATCKGTTEVETRAMMGTVKDALAVALPLGLVLLPTRLGQALAVLLVFLGPFALSPFLNWLMPELEIHDGRSRIRRSLIWLASAVITPTVIALVLHAAGI